MCVQFLLLLSFLLVFASPLFAASHVVMTMICRDEEVNLKTNLPLWLISDAIDYFVFLLDDRNVDASVATIESILGPTKKQYTIQSYRFEGFGPARTLSLQIAWRDYPHATHVLIADPDWRPDINTLDMNDLDDTVDVFRFIAYDRNGITRRRMDWMLRQKQGLAMRYHLHEVLDIGYYSVKDIKWVVHEIEQMGSWHTTVGHGNSRSSKRYGFDLNLLYKDLLTFGHDPHVHYYLGITLHAYAETLFVETGSLNHNIINEAVKYLEKRIYSVYTDEFIEERWACMYILGSVYSSLKRDYVSSVKWYSLCRDYNPKQAECSVALANLFLQNNLFDQASKEIEKVLQEELEERLMLNMIRTKQCDVPEIAAKILIIKGRNNIISLQEWKYLILLIQMLENPLCLQDSVKLMEESRSISKTLNFYQDDGIFLNKLKFCEERDLQSYIRQQKYVIHPCEQFAEQIELEKSCGIFFSVLPPAVEEYQMNTNYKKFIGAALPHDFIHHVYGGDGSFVFGRTEKSPYRILFAHYFDILMVQNLIGVFKLEKFENYLLTVVTEDIIIANQLRVQLSKCLGFIDINLLRIEIIELPLSEYLRNSSQDIPMFDYIEYNGGLSFDENYLDNLASLRNVLTTNGILGITYFQANRHSNSIKLHLESLNNSVMLPFSSDPVRYVQQYLSINKLDFMLNDEQLFTFLSGDINWKSARTKRSMAGRKWKSYSRKQVVDTLSSLHLVDAAWVPTAYMHPYEEIKHYNVQRFKAVGLLEDLFLDEFFSGFRATVYAIRSDHGFFLDRLQPTEALFRHSSKCKNIYIVDRLGQFSTSLQPLVDLAKAGISGKFGFTPSYSHGYFGLDYVSTPFLSQALAILSTRPTLCELLSKCMEFAAENHIAIREDIAISALVDVLSYLEHINAIAFSFLAKSSAMFNWDSDDLVHTLQSVFQDGSFNSDSNHSTTKVWIEIGDFSENYYKFLDATPQTVERRVYSSSRKLKALNPDDDADEYYDEKDISIINLKTNSQIQLVMINSDLEFSLIWWNTVKMRLMNGAAIICVNNFASSKLFNKIFESMIVSEYTQPHHTDQRDSITVFKVIFNPFLEMNIAGIVNETVVDSSSLQLQRARELGLEDTLIETEMLFIEDNSNVSISIDQHSDRSSKLLVFSELSNKIQSLMGHIGKNIEKVEHFIGVESEEQNVFAVNSIGDISTAEVGVDEDPRKLLSFFLESKAIKLPTKLSSRKELLQSFRRAECIIGLIQKSAVASCTQRKPLKRRTSANYITSPRKLRFDILQIQYLLSLNLINNETAAIHIENFQSILADFEIRPRSPTRVVKLVADSKHQPAFYLNRGVYLSPDDAVNKTFLYWGAIKQLQKISNDKIDRDFAVLDMIMPPTVLKNFTELFRTSSIWFDVANGASFASHHDDSLYFSSVSLLSQQLAFALSSASTTLRVVKYFAMSMMPDDIFRTAASYANRNEVIAILCLDSLPSDNLFLQLLDGQSIECLFRQGVSIYPSVHPEFLSKGGDLDISLTERCDSYQPELIPFHPNRLVVLYSRSPFAFISTSVKKPITSFEESSFAIVFIFEKV